ncbi:MAG: response regulator [Chloroflexi bacterium]|nr:MAG: response regulator [Chloroflexota bacterium]
MPDRGQAEHAAAVMSIDNRLRACRAAREVRSVELLTEPVLPRRPEKAAIRILVADDNAVSAELLHDHLEAQGYQVDWAWDGDHALAMAASGAYQVMLLDVHMPVYDGVEVMRRLHLLKGRPLRVIAVTADRLATRREELTRMGIDGYLTKPLDLDRLNQELERVLLKSGL